MTDFEPTMPRALLDADPVRREGPPGPGTHRYLKILEHAMTDVDRTESSATDDSPDVPSPTPMTARTSRGHWKLRGAIAAAAVVLVAVALLVKPFGSTKTASAAEVLTDAAATTADATSYRVHGVYVDGTAASPEETRRTLQANVDGENVELHFRSIDPASGRSESSILVVIGDRTWESDGDEITERPTDPPAQRNAPFTVSSKAVVNALIPGSKITELGQESVRGVTAEHYRIALTPASIERLSALPANQLSAFELEYPQDVSRIDLWVTDGLIRRISVLSGSSLVSANGSQSGITRMESTIEFYDFGADITITPPESS